MADLTHKYIQRGKLNDTCWDGWIFQRAWIYIEGERVLREQASGLDCVTLAASLRPPLPFAPLCLAPVFNQFNASRVATNFKSCSFFVLTWTCVSFALRSGDQFWLGWLSNCPNKSTRRSQPHFAPFGPKVPASKRGLSNPKDQWRRMIGTGRLCPRGASQFASAAALCQ